MQRGDRTDKAFAGFFVTGCSLRTPSSDRVTFEFQWTNPRTEDEETGRIWRDLEERLLPSLKRAAKEEGKMFQDGPQVDMVNAYVERDQERRGTKTLWHCQLAETRYHKFACTSLHLDEEVSHMLRLAPREKTLRRIWDEEPSDLSDVRRLPAPACVGTVTVVVTEEGQIVCMKRARAHYVSGRDCGRGGGTPQPLHFVGEGMLPEDIPEGGSCPVPTETARRALRDELGIGTGDEDRTEIAEIGMFFDNLRWQPIFCFLARVNMTLEALKMRALAAKDSFEILRDDLANCGLVPVEWSIRNKRTRNLLIREMRYKNDHYELVSNHAKVAMLLALQFADGPEEISRRVPGNFLSERSLCSRRP